MFVLASSNDGFFFAQFQSTFAHFSHKLPGWGLFLPRWGLFLPRFPPPTPVLYSAITHLSGICTYIKRPPHPTPKHPFSKTAPRPAPSSPAPPRARPRRLPPAGVVLSVGKCAPSGQLPPAERPARAAAQMRRCASGSVNATA